MEKVSAEQLRVSVVIVNWNGARVLPSCLESLNRQSRPADQIIVVDNGSTDGSANWLKQLKGANLVRVFLDTNTGFSGGNNAALPHVTGDVIALLNYDARPHRDWIAAALPLFEQERVGMVACKSLCLDDPSQIDKAGHLIYFDGLNRGRGTGHKDDIRYQCGEEVLWPDGSAGFYLKSAIDEVGFLDEDFFLYGEDAELGMRLRWAGYRCLFQPRSVINHEHSVGLGKYAPKKVYYIERNRLWLMVKTFPLSMILLSPWYTALRFFFNGLSLLKGRGAAASFNESHGKGPLLKALVQAVWDGLKGVPKMWSKRKRYPKRMSTAEMKKLLNAHRISAAEITLTD